MFGFEIVLEKIFADAAGVIHELVLDWEKETDASTLEHIAECMCGLHGSPGLTVKDRKLRFKSFKSCFVGKEAVVFFIKEKFVKNTRDAVALGNRMLRHTIFQRVTGTAAKFENATVFYRFTKQTLTFTESDVRRLVFSREELIGFLRECSKLGTGGPEDLLSGAALVERFIEIAAVDNTKDAVLLGNLMILEHVLGKENKTMSTSNGKPGTRFLLMPTPNAMTTSFAVKSKLLAQKKQQFFNAEDLVYRMHLDSDRKLTSSNTKGSPISKDAHLDQPRVQWEFVQSFGDDSSAYDIDDADDLITAVEFNQTGEFLAIGDKAGRISIVQEASVPNLPLEYKFYTEFQSHEPQFDTLKSMEIEPRISVIRWWPSSTLHLHLLTSNDKTIKLWKLGNMRDSSTIDREARKQVARDRLVKSLGLDPAFNQPETDDSPESGDAEPPEDEGEAEDVVQVSNTKMFKNAHSFNINSLSINSDGETFMSADDLTINIWNVEYSNTCFNTVNFKTDPHKPVKQFEELITAASFHPISCNLLMFGNSNGMVRISDMRKKALVDNHADIEIDNTCKVANQNNYYSEIINSVLDARFSEDGRYLLVRDFMCTCLWDLAYTSQPVAVHQVHPHLEGHMSTLADCEAIFDQFQVAIHPSGRHFVTGSYDNCFYVHNREEQTSLTIRASDDRRAPYVVSSYPRHKRPHYTQKPSEQPLLGSMPEPLTGGLSLDPLLGRRMNEDVLRNKVLQVAWHPRTHAIAVAGLYKLYLYQGGRSLNPNLM